MRKKFYNQQAGFTLVEVLAAIAIFSAVTTIFLGIFLQSFDYVKGNQSKSVGIHAARNAVLFMESQDFETVEGYVGQTLEPSKCEQYTSLFKDDQCSTFLNPTINNIEYEVEVTIQPYNVEDMGIPEDHNRIEKVLEQIENQNEEQDNQTKVSNLIIRTEATIDWKEGNNARTSSSVTGFVIHESIR
ncbi:prepilin-type N-terminal cleavage/methylation domain-containing protein [Pontibacillus yanchengensis]|uniref:Prepilin-type N-terminal cleavage/methylation domain-containing protein n=1 Tax=Pontibacillus yanchengensis TaxID=462910 RepID=A0ACC7VEF5_9BACI|nr:type II secretion system protein [Pontibacillus yanchengensis]MYL53351.1 prepilin-type N-terminal cleavage/methylation domain-containing protein [Pontibacillus yanchengensis]